MDVLLFNLRICSLDVGRTMLVKYFIVWFGWILLLYCWRHSLENLSEGMSRISEGDSLKLLSFN